ncbi:MAG: hypothetical protein AABY08_03185, partial [Candidatus Thermoplasmatota archaeon]
ATRLLGPPSRKLLQRARAAVATTSLDVSTDPLGWPQLRRDAVLAVLPHVDAFFGNEEEVTRVAGRSPIEDAAETLGLRVAVAYFELLRLRGQVALAVQSVEAHERTLRQVETLARGGA